MVNDQGETLGSLCGIDFGRGNEPDGQPYARVVEAELASCHTFTREAEMTCLFDGASGVYIPQQFADEISRKCVEGVSDEDYETLAAGPEHEWYWETWNDVLDNAVLTEPSTGRRYTMHQDGDVFLIEEGAEFDEETESYFVEF